MYIILLKEEDMIKENHFPIIAHINEAYNNDLLEFIECMIKGIGVGYDYTCSSFWDESDEYDKENTEKYDGLMIETEDDEKVILWFKEKKVIFNEYYLIVGRFVPENNYETMIMEFMKSKTLKDLVIITNVEENKFYNQLEKETHFSMDKRIKFVGTVYDKELLKKIRENAFAYIHGHSVGGTNPSLLEALALTNINLLFDVPYNREVANTAAIYFDKKIESLSNKINYLETSSEQIRRVYKKEAAKQIQNNYLWNDIVYQYENLVKIK